MRIALLAGVVLLIVAAWLAVDNPDISHTSRGEDYTCLAPWDTVLNGADNFPGGEPPVDADSIASRCRDAGRERFAVATGCAAAAILLVGAAVMRRRSVSGDPS